jgi:Ca2+-binding EF-hand superfamily protein
MLILRAHPPCRYKGEFQDQSRGSFLGDRSTDDNDDDDDSTINMIEFIQMECLRTGKCDLPFLKDVFNHFEACDLTGSGKITRDEILCSLMFGRYDVDESGFLEFDEFVLCVNELSTLEGSALFGTTYDKADLNAVYDAANNGQHGNEDEGGGGDKGIDRAEFMAFLMQETKEAGEAGEVGEEMKETKEANGAKEAEGGAEGNAGGVAEKDEEHKAGAAGGHVGGGGGGGGEAVDAPDGGGEVEIDGDLYFSAIGGTIGLGALGAGGALQGGVKGEVYEEYGGVDGGGDGLSLTPRNAKKESVEIII